MKKSDITSGTLVVKEGDTEVYRVVRKPFLQTYGSQRGLTIVSLYNKNCTMSVTLGYFLRYYHRVPKNNPMKNYTKNLLLAALLCCSFAAHSQDTIIYSGDDTLYITHYDGWNYVTDDENNEYYTFQDEDYLYTTDGDGAPVQVYSLYNHFHRMYYGRPIISVFDLAPKGTHISYVHLNGENLNVTTLEWDCDRKRGWITKGATISSLYLDLGELINDFLDITTKYPPRKN